jgi:hypothetical protein
MSKCELICRYCYYYYYYYYYFIVIIVINKCELIYDGSEVIALLSTCFFSLNGP